MKTKKKILLLGVGAMGIVALGVGTTSTFAWYQANSLAGRVKTIVQDVDLSVSDPGYTATAVDLPLNIFVETGSKILELAHYYGAGDLDGKARADGGTWVDTGGDDDATFDQDAGFYRAWYRTAQTSSIIFDDGPVDGDHELAHIYTISAQVAFPAAGAAGVLANKAAAVSAGGNTYFTDTEDEDETKWLDSNLNVWDQATAITKLNGQTPKFDLATRGANNRAKFYGAGTSSAPAAAAGSTSATNVNCITLANIGTKMAIGYFGYYVDGDDSGVKDVADVNGNFTVTVHA